jgi:P pilus assembly chaperone PapD
LIAPPLYRLDARQSQTFRLLGQPTALASLPKDRESAFYVSVKMLPEKANGKESGGTGGVDMSLSMVLVNNAKLFYRPAGLKPASVGEASEQLHFQRAGGRLVAENPTPYYMSFATLKVNGVSVSDADRFRMTPPRGKAEYALPVGKSGATVVEWQVLDENGRATTLRRQPLE